MINVLYGLTTKDLPLINTVYFIKQVLTVIFIVVPIIVIVMSIIDLIKIIINAEEMKKSSSMLIKRILYCMLVFFIPTVVNYSTNLVGYNFMSSNIWVDSTKENIETLKEIKDQERVAYDNALANEQEKLKQEQEKKERESKQKFETLMKDNNSNAQQDGTVNNNTDSSSQKNTIQDIVDSNTSGNPKVDTGSENSSANYSKRGEIVEFAKSFVGVLPYVYGGTSLETGVDCSGFVQQVYNHFGISIPRVANDQANSGTSVSESNMQIGDLVFYGSGSYANHVAMYIGDGQIVHAQCTKCGPVKISDINYNTIIARRSFINE